VHIATRRLADTVVFTVIGRVDHRTAAELEHALDGVMPAVGEAPCAVVLDFSGVEYISSVGLRVLMVCARKLRGSAATFAVAALQPVVAEIFAISRFDRVLVVRPDVPSALAHGSVAALAAWQAATPPGLPREP
jgi:anti-sigma B factor antagonist/stage II sporulation protein AA (anti-sigma F factor antagonist)